MTKEEYTTSGLHCALAAKMLIAHDLPDILSRIDRAETVGPFLDPTLYRDKAKAMGEDRRIIEAALPLWRLGKDLERRATEEE